MASRETISAAVLYNAGKALKEQRRFLEAAEHFHRALAIDPADAESACMLAGCFRELDSLEESLVAYDAALTLRPASPDALNDKGVVLQRLGDPDGAIGCFRRAVALQPGHAEAHWNLSQVLLLTGAEEEGWREYEWRWSLPTFLNFGRVPTAPRWDGRPGGPTRLLLRTEQGPGDAIQFARYVPLASERCARVWLECPRELTRLFAGLAGGAGIVEEGSPLPQHTNECSLMSLPGLPGFSPRGRRWTVPYLMSAPELSRSWEERLARFGGRRIGLIWSGRAGSDTERAVALEQLLPLSSIPGISWISLQQGGARVQREGLCWEMMDAGPLLRDFADTAAVMQHLDLVISIDTAAAHLAGALGRTVWTLIPFAPDWRWGTVSSTTPWYPTMRLFRQTVRGSWDAVVPALVAALKHRLLRSEEGAVGQVCTDAGVWHTPDLLRKGNQAAEAGDHAEAEQLFREAVRADDRLVAAWFNLGNALAHQQRHREAIHCYRKARALDPEQHAILHNLGAALAAVRDHEEAIRCLTAAVERFPSSADYLNSLGNAQAGAGKHEEALDSYHRALALTPLAPHLHYNAGEELFKLWRVPEAAASYRKAISLDQGFLAAYHNLGYALLSDRRVGEAVEMYERGLAIAPGDPELRWNLAQAYLLTGDYVRGWRLYEDRWQTAQFRPHHREFPFPPWDGSAPEGKTILLTTEQGFGDALQFARYAGVLAERGARVVLACPPELLRLFSSLPGVGRVITSDEDPGKCDAFCPLMSLPARLGTTLETVPADVPYLDVETCLLEEWRQRIGGQDGRLRVGIVWGGRTGRWNERHRSLALRDLLPLGEIPGVSLFSLQMGPAAREIRPAHGQAPITDVTGEVRDFADTAALLLNLDCVVGIDTAVIHLAGALGKPVWAMLPYAADWRWLLDREDSPWYPTMTLVRQETPGGWGPVIARVRDDLEHILRQGSVASAPARAATPACGAGSAAIIAGNIAGLNAAGLRMLQQGEPRGARRFFQQALRAAPCNSVLLNNVGVTLQESRDTAAELVWFRAAVRADQTLVDAHWNLAQAALATGSLEEGWREYEWRWLKDDFTSPRPDFGRPRWRGGALAGRSVLIHAEQGHGDSLQFCRYLRHPRLAGGDLVFMVQPALLKLMRTAFPEARVIAWGDPVPETTLHVPLMSIPGIVGTTLEQIPAVTPYLTVPEAAARAWQGKIVRPSGGIAAGVVWRGRSSQRMDRNRSVSLNALRELAEIAGVAWYSLQMGDARRELQAESDLRTVIRDLAPDLRDFADTAAVIEALDVVVTVDTAVAHLAGALGKPVLLVLATPADWRWLRGRDDSPWYPTLRLFRQERAGVWEGVVQRVADAIRHRNFRPRGNGGGGWGGV